MRARLARLALAASLLGGGFAVVSAAEGAHAMTVCNPTNSCGIPPTTVPKPGPPTVTFGCGTVTVTSGNVSATAPILPCPGPVIA